MAVPQHRRILGETLRELRERARLTQETLAEKADLNPKYVSEVERGNVNVSIDALVRVAKALRVRVQDLTRRI